MKIDGFMVALAAAVLLAILWPQFGASGGLLRLEFVARYGAAIIFFLYGLTLSSEKLRAGASKWRVHLIVQTTTFVFLPLVMLSVGAVSRPATDSALWLGFLYVAALPTTVSSAVAMTSMARGDVPAAIFNTTISAFFAVAVTPALMAFFVAGLGGDISFGPAIAKIATLVLAPLVAGQIFRPFLRRFADRHSRQLKQVDRLVILAIIINAFSDSVQQKAWSSQSPFSLAITIVAVCAIFAVAYGWTAFLARVMNLPRGEGIAAMFCGSNKSLVTGAPMAPLIFGHVPNLAIILTPLMIYHLLQLVVIGVIASWYAAESEEHAQGEA